MGIIRKGLAVLATLLLALGAVALSATAAQAHHATITGTFQCTGPEEGNVTWTIVNSENRFATTQYGSMQPNGSIQLIRKVVGTGTHTLTVNTIWENGVQATNTGSVTLTPPDFSPCRQTPQPQVVVTYDEWQDVSGDCETGTVTQTRTTTTTTTPYGWRIGGGGFEWYLDTANATTTTATETTTRPMTSEELDVCAGPQPEDLVIVTESAWEDGAYGCGDTEVEQTRTVTTETTSYILVDHEWVEDGLPTSSQVTETQTRQLTEEERTECPVPTEPEPTKPEAAPVAPAPDKLALTGSETAVTSGMIGAGGLLLAGAAALVFSRRRKAADRS